MSFSRPYTRPAALSATQPISNAARKSPSVFCIGIILTLGIFASCGAAQEPPPNLAKLVAQKESEALAERSQYTYRQTVTLEELNDLGARVGEYHEVRDIIFSPQHERTEELVGKPEMNLKRLILTPQDFQDIRQIQPFVIPEEQLWLYETKYRGEENVDGVDCYVLQVRPRQILSEQRLFDGLLWVSEKDYSVVRMQGKAVPEIRSLKSENLFPLFTTIRRPIDGKHWFPIYTYADDTLYFRNGPVRIRLSIRYSNYKRFGAESTIQFEKKK